MVSALRNHMLCIKSEKYETIVQTSDVIIGIQRVEMNLLCVGKSGHLFVYKIIEGIEINLKLVDNYKPNEKLIGSISAVDLHSFDY